MYSSIAQKINQSEVRGLLGKSDDLNVREGLEFSVNFFIGTGPAADFGSNVAFKFLVIATSLFS